MKIVVDGVGNLLIMRASFTGTGALINESGL